MKKALTIAAILAASFGLLGYSATSWGAEQTTGSASSSGKVTTIKPAHKTAAKRHSKKNVKKKTKKSLKGDTSTTTTDKTGKTTGLGTQKGSITPANPNSSLNSGSSLVK